MTAVIFDETAKYAGQPVLHAIVIGVSHYQHLPDPGGNPVQGALGLQKLTAASKTAVEIARWLQRRHDRLALPLATLRLCAAPTVEDQLKQETMPPPGASGATRNDVAAALNEWRGIQQPDDVALFYFAGHGVQISRSDMVLLCADFNAPADGPLSRAIELAHIRNGLGRTAQSATIARTQMYFVDACRERPAAFNNFDDLAVPDIWGVQNLKAKDDRRAPIFYATTPGALAYADAGVATLFSRTLIRCLEGEAAALDDATGDWQITSKSLEQALATRFRALAGAATDQECDTDHAMHDFLISRLAEPPMCSFRLQIHPDAAVPVTEVRIHDLDRAVDLPVPQPLQPHPLDVELPGGYYSFLAKAQAPYVAPKAKTLLIAPTRLAGFTFKVEP